MSNYLTDEQKAALRAMLPKERLEVPNQAATAVTAVIGLDTSICFCDCVNPDEYDDKQAHAGGDLDAHGYSEQG